MLVSLKGIYKSYHESQVVVPVLKNINLEVQEGEYIAIMGPSGSGKTTLMNILGCLDHQDDGQYLLDGMDVRSLSEDELSDVRLHKIGFVFQQFQLLPKQSVLENVALPLVYAKVDKKEREQRALEVLNKVGLKEKAPFFFLYFSGGQKQRVAIARALINHPRIVRADEPTGALDQASGRQVMELFQKLHEEGATIVMITHDKNVADHAHKIFHIIDGEISKGETL